MREFLAVLVFFSCVCVRVPLVSKSIFWCYVPLFVFFFRRLAKHAMEIDTLGFVRVVRCRDAGMLGCRESFNFVQVQPRMFRRQ